MRFVTLAFVLLMAAALSLPANAEKMSMKGFLVDKQCVNLCETVEEGVPCTPDQTNVFYNPQDHTGWCLLLQVCVDSGFVLMSEEKMQDGRHAVLLDMAASQDAVVSYIQAGTNGAFPAVVVEYELAMLGDYGAPQPLSANISDPWDADTYFTGAPTHQVVCDDASMADISTNNMCFRADVVVTELADGESIMIESNGTS